MNALEELFWANVERSEDGCLRWTGRKDTAGYGIITFGAHRLAYLLFKGAIPAGLALDHVKERGCTHRDCVDVEHLEPVTHKVNILRGDGWGGHNSRKTHCPRGHEYTPENLAKGQKNRVCLACKRERNKLAARVTKNWQGHEGSGWARDKTHCPAGHAYDDANTYHYKGRRHCRACGRIRSAARDQAKRAKH